MVLVVVCQAALAVGGTYSGKRWPSVARPRYVFVETRCACHEYMYRRLVGRASHYCRVHKIRGYKLEE